MEVWHWQEFKRRNWNTKQWKLIGKWDWFHTNGKINTERLYTNAKLIPIISCFDGNGKQLDKGNLNDGNGKLNLFDIDGNLIKVQNFKDGEYLKNDIPSAIFST